MRRGCPSVRYYKTLEFCRMEQILRIGRNEFLNECEPLPMKGAESEDESQ
jgi:hypothetical protein